MSEPIKAGDLVVMVRGHSCLFEKRGGIPFVVTEFINPIGGGWTCNYCNQRSVAPNEVAALGSFPNKKPTKRSAPAIPISWLKRIPPIEELDDVKHEEEITA